MLQPCINNHKADKLNAQVEQYLKAGGQIESLPGPTLAPRPPRRDPKPRKKKIRRQLVPAHVARYRTYGPQIIDMRERGLLIAEIARAIKKSGTFVSSCLAYFGVSDEAAEESARELKEMIESLRIMAKDGHSAAYTAQQLGVTDSKVRYHADRHDIQFRKE